MPSPVLLRGGTRLFLIRPGSDEWVSEPIASNAKSAALEVESDLPNGLPRRISLALASGQSDEPVLSTEVSLLRAVARSGRSSKPTTTEAVAELQSKLPRDSAAVEREFLLERARLALERLAASPEEQLVALAREEERTEKALGREVGSANAWLDPEGTHLAEHERRWKAFRTDFSRHHDELRRRVESVAADLAPNLSKLVGARTAARLVAAAGGLGPLSRMTAGRLQLLGARRRPGPHGPRFGVLYASVATSGVPPHHQGAFARSLASLAVIAARADATTHRQVWTELARRRDRRLQYLVRRP